MRPEGLLRQSSAPRQEMSNSCSCCQFGLEVQPSLAKMEQGTVPGTPPAHKGGLLHQVSGGVRELIHPWVFVKHLRVSSIGDWRSIAKSQKLETPLYLIYLYQCRTVFFNPHSGSMSEKKSTELLSGDD